MKRAILGAVAVGMILTMAAVAQQQFGLPAAQPAVANGSELSVVSMPDRGLVVVVDQRQHSMCVYQIDQNCKIVLKSERRIEWDLQLMDFNATDPKPQTIRSMLDNKR
jgi:hypothetical protein